MKKVDLLQGTLDLLILKSLTGGPIHGYRIAQKIRELSDEVLRVEEGSLYPALQRMAIEGRVKAEWGQSENNRRARYKNLTPAGRKQLNQEVADFGRLLEAILRVVEPT